MVEQLRIQTARGRGRRSKIFTGQQRNIEETILSTGSWEKAWGEEPASVAPQPQNYYSFFIFRATGATHGRFQAYLTERGQGSNLPPHPLLTHWATAGTPSSLILSSLLTPNSFSMLMLSKYMFLTQTSVLNSGFFIQLLAQISTWMIHNVFITYISTWNTISISNIY